MVYLETMFKEYLLAIIMGALLGFGATGGYYSLKKGPGPVNPDQPTLVTPGPALQTETPPSPPDENQQFIIETPENYAIVNNSKIDITGYTTPQSVLIFSTPVGIYIAKSGNSGSFSQKIDLETGFNIIQIAAIDPKDKQSNFELVVTYSTADI